MRLVALCLALIVLATAANAQTGKPPRRSQLAPVGGAVPCDIGPSVPSIPTEAQQAGLTHCVANFDFSQSTYAVPAYKTGVPGSWANCRGENNNIAGIIWHGGSGGIRQTTPCDAKQKIDPLDGSTVMNFEWRRERGLGFGLMTWNQYNGGNPNLTVGNYYVETINRLESLCPSPSVCPPNSGGPSDVYMYPSPGSYGTEIDIQEFQTNTTDGKTGVAAGNCGYSNGGKPCWSNWAGGNTAIIGIPNYSNAVFHKYSALSTSDGVHDKRICMYIDDILQNSNGCLVEQGGAAGTNDTNFFTRNMISAGLSSSGGNAGQPIDFNVKNIIVWSCANYKRAGSAGMCNGSTLFSQVQGNGQTLAYYH